MSLSLKHSPAFIVLEGIDGAGKTEVSKKLVSLLKEEGIPALYTYEPFTREFTEMIKNYGRRYGALMEALLMAADRYYHIQEIIKPALEAGKVVVSDRYFYSSIAYQGARGIEPSWVKLVNSFVLKPDLAIYIDVPPEVGLKRKRASSTRVPYLEKDIKVMRKVRSIYKSLVESGELFEVDGSKQFFDVIKSCVRLLCDNLGLLCKFKYNRQV